VALSSVVGATAGGILLAVAGRVAGLPDFWGIGLIVAILAFVAVALGAAGDWYYVPAAIAAFGVVVFWWIATGMDGWAPGGGGRDSLASLAKPTTAGTGAFGGVLSTPWVAVWLSCLVSLLVGCLLAWASMAVTANRRDTVSDTAPGRPAGAL